MPTLALLRGARRSKLLGLVALGLLVLFSLTSLSLSGGGPKHGQLPPALIPQAAPRPGAPPKAPAPARTLRRVANASSLLVDLPPDFPPAGSLRHPSTFAQFASPPPSQRPVVDKFPDELLKDIRPEAWTGTVGPAGGLWDPPRGSFAREWSAPEHVEFGPGKQQAGALPRIQFDFPPEDERDPDRRQLVAERREVVRNAFL